MNSLECLLVLDHWLVRHFNCVVVSAVPRRRIAAVHGVRNVRDDRVRNTGRAFQQLERYLCGAVRGAPCLLRPACSVISAVALYAIRQMSALAIAPLSVSVLH